MTNSTRFLDIDRKDCFLDRYPGFRWLFFLGHQSPGRADYYALGAVVTA